MEISSDALIVNRLFRRLWHAMLTLGDAVARKGCSVPCTWFEAVDSMSLVEGKN